MNKKDAVLVATFVTNMTNAMRPGSNANPLAVVAQFMKEVEGTPGTGACICSESPEAYAAHAARMHCSPEVYGGTMRIDHRCPHHGEKAQPGLWGRHKEKVLFPTWAEWSSLGVKQP